ncbi:MAG: sugar transferase [Syntrophorhabdus sp.]
MKRIFDLAFAVLLIVLLAIPMMIIAIIIRIDIGSPVLFKQQRPGYRSKPFVLLKFRTMRDTRDENNQLLPDNLRLSSLGIVLRKLSLDELPQIFNVIKGDLSFVGPRPLLMEYLPLYTSRQARRHDVKPGITGWTQVNGRNALTWDEKFEHDIWYVEHRSFLLEMKILGMTITKVMKREGITAQGSATMPLFKGSKGER